MRKPRRKAPPHCFWKGPVLYGRQTIRGRKKRWSLKTGDYDTAKERVEADRARAVSAAHYGDARTTFEDAMKGWLNSYVPERAIGANTAKRYLVSIGQMTEHLDGLYVDEIDLRLVDKIAASRRAAGVSSATLRRDLGALASVLAYAKAQRLRPDNPALDRLREVRERRDPIVLPDPAHVARVMARAPGLIPAAVAAARLTGCRLEELVGALRTNLDHARRELTVIGKGNKLRVIGLDYEGGYDLLRALPAHVGCKWLFWHGAGQPYRNLSSRFAALVREVFLTAYDETHGTTERTRPPLHKLLAVQDDKDWTDIGFRPFRFHDLRHLHAVEWLRSGRSIYDLQGRLGHKSIVTTEGYLKYLTPEEARAAQHQGTPIRTPQPKIISIGKGSTQ